MKLSNILIAIIFTGVGVLGTILTNNAISKEKSENINSGVINSVHKLEEGMNGVFESQKEKMDEVFGKMHLSHNPDPSSSKVVKNETDEKYVYKLYFEGFNKEDIELSVKNKTLYLKAKKQADEVLENNKYTSRASFSYSFYLPEFDENSEPKIEITEKIATVTLDKVKK